MSQKRTIGALSRESGVHLETIRSRADRPLARAAAFRQRLPVLRRRGGPAAALHPSGSGTRFPHRGNQDAAPTGRPPPSTLPGSGSVGAGAFARGGGQDRRSEGDACGVGPARPLPKRHGRTLPADRGVGTTPVRYGTGWRTETERTGRTAFRQGGDSTKTTARIDTLNAAAADAGGRLPDSVDTLPLRSGRGDPAPRRNPASFVSRRRWKGGDCATNDEPQRTHRSKGKRRA